MDQTLQAPRTGRSRFSKALPVPPPALDGRPQTTPRVLPPLSPFPPRKDSTSVKTTSSISSKTKPLDSPLPALPPQMDAYQFSAPMKVIPRRPVGQPAVRPAVQPVTSPAEEPTAISEAEAKKMKRKSSISSLLSAYSHTSSDSVQRSSEGSFRTKDSEPSYSPDGEGMQSVLKGSSESFAAFSGNPYAEEANPVEDGMFGSEALPPPPPLKDIGRPTTSQSQRQFGASQLSDAVLPSMPMGNGSSPKREIWRRRASSKSDRSLAVAELKLSVSHGSTAASAQAPKTESRIPEPLEKDKPMPSHTSEQNSLKQNGQKSLRSLPPNPSPLPSVPPRSTARLERLTHTNELKSNGSINHFIANPLPVKTGPLPPIPPSKSNKSSQHEASNEKNVPASDLSSKPSLPNMTESRSLPPLPNSNTTAAALPPRGASLPGRNIRPVKAPSPEASQKGEVGQISQNLASGVNEQSPRRGKDVETAEKREGTTEPAARPTAELRDVKETSTKTTESAATTQTHAPRAELPQFHVTAPVLPPQKESGKPFTRRPVGGGPASSHGQQTPAAAQQQQQRLNPKTSRDFARPSLAAPRQRPQPPQQQQQRPGSRGGSSPRHMAALETPQTAAAPPLSPAPPSPRPQSREALYNLAEAHTNPFHHSRVAPPRHVAGGVSAAALDDVREAGEGDRMSKIEDGEQGRDGKEKEEEEKEDKEEAAEPPRTPAVTAALEKFPRELLLLAQQQQQERLSPTTTNPPHCHSPKPLSPRPFSCFQRHASMLTVANDRYPVACAMCRAQDAEPRRVCAWCALRVCLACDEVLRGEGVDGDLARALEEVENRRRRGGKGKEIERA
ncbi:hypothetical protein F4778DRAFT_173901 [Xylariomycetidae sp. FL2044]|nr:hypothetical protein F4778DRAFT_173901 [Xylariomycetidae sp. FL2044]